MENKKFIKENFLTKLPKRNGLNSTLMLMSLLLFTSFIYINNLFDAPDWMAANGMLVFSDGQWWRAWTTLFAHGDLSHIFSNLFLFFPFSYYLISYFGYSFFPIFGFFFGGLVNLVVLHTMPVQVGLIGVSGVVNWMGGAWLTLAWLIDRRDSNGRRILKVVAVTIILFIPDSFKPEVSYLSHFTGYFGGVLSAIFYYQIFKKKIKSEEVIEVIHEDDHVWGNEFDFTDDSEVTPTDHPISDSPYHQKVL